MSAPSRKSGVSPASLDGSDVDGGGRERAPLTPAVPEGYVVRAVVRAVQLLELLRTSDDGGAGLQVLAARSGLAKASAYRMLRTLEETGLAERVPGSDRFRLGVRCLEFGQAYLEQIDLRREALPVMERLRADCNETVHLGVLDDRLRVVYLEKLDSAHAVGVMMSRVGRTAPSYCTGLGKALLSAQDGDPAGLLEEWGELRRHTPNTISTPDDLRAELKRVRSRGYSLDLEEHEPGVRCVAAVIAGPPGAPPAAVSIAGPAQRLPDKLLRGELAAAATAAAREIGRRIGAAQGVEG
jgi:DNA-binding IclR family transcriptional regulator